MCKIICKKDLLFCIVPIRMDIKEINNLEEMIESSLNNYTKVVFDFLECKYLSSSFLRLVYFLSMKLGEDGISIVNVRNYTVQRVLDQTGIVCE